MSTFLSIIGGLVVLAIIAVIAFYAFSVLAGSAIVFVIAAVVILILIFAFKGCTSASGTSLILMANAILTIVSGT